MPSNYNLNIEPVTNKAALKRLRLRLPYVKLYDSGGVFIAYQVSFFLAEVIAMLGSNGGQIFE